MERNTKVILVSTVFAIILIMLFNLDAITGFQTLNYDTLFTENMSVLGPIIVLTIIFGLATYLFEKIN